MIQDHIRHRKKRVTSKAGRSQPITRTWPRSKPQGFSEELTTLLIISLFLTVFFSLYFLGRNLVIVLDETATVSQVSVYLREDLPENQVAEIKNKTEKLRGVREVTYISGQQGLADLTQSGFSHAVDLLNDFRLPGVLLISLNGTDEQRTQSVIRSIRSESGGITDVRLDKDSITRTETLRKPLCLLILLICLVFTALYLSIGHALRCNISRKKNEIETMRLIGATDRFILKPYFYTSMWLGCLGSVFAWTLTALLTTLISNPFEELATIIGAKYQTLRPSWCESLTLITVGITLSSTAAKRSLQRYLKNLYP